MDITALDRSAIAGSSLLHGASAGSKLIAVAILLAAVVTSSNSMLMGATALVLVAAGAAAGLDMRILLGLSAYPALFAAVFAFASAPSLGSAATIVLKAVTAALCAVMLVMTTPYPLVFSKLQLVLPQVAGDALLMTYRTFFLLAERFSHLMTAIRLRSAREGRGARLATARVVSSALGNTVLYAFDLAERDYDVLNLRGYSKRLHVAPARRRSPGADAVVLGLSASAAAVVFVWRFGASRLNPYSWLPLLVAAALLGIASVWRWTRERTD